MINHEIFVGNDNDSIAVLAGTADGNEAPTRTVGASSHLNELKGIAVDTVNNEVFLASSGNNSIAVYAKTAQGGAAPLRTISGPATGLSGPVSIAVDLLDDQIFVGNSSSKSITVYARTAKGNAAPLRTISGPSTGLGALKNLVVDMVNNEIIAVNLHYPSAPPEPVPPTSSITVYARTAEGDAAPLRTISTGYAPVNGIAVDTANNEIFVGNSGDNSIAVYARTANGYTAPLRTISGDATGIFGITDIAVDTANNEIYVANVLHYYSDDYAITVYARTASGNSAPLRTIVGRSTGLNFPGGIALAIQ
jgi:hypothetical protein